MAIFFLFFSPAMKTLGNNKYFTSINNYNWCEDLDSNHRWAQIRSDPHRGEESLIFGATIWKLRKSFVFVCVLAIFSTQHQVQQIIIAMCHIKIVSVAIRMTLQHFEKFCQRREKTVGNYGLKILHAYKSLFMFNLIRKNESLK